ncbi:MULTISPECIES: YncE family protein [Clostridium]|uniref:40-residue YVTN family beta-propeller repeat protein n=1 Tax=Clostridium saccharoperbutylacetonicum N1-4(HMT) TaxID=931276 RepID=M1MHA1_9CLOT|nr:MULTISPECIES: YncE family protein [Clostridium]AGF57279.1 40-residue YVTN family beta-propeller repeat protein [Clostridium saccharoperbutylacetonicum N1-4(HMT)]AQR95971.1 cytochrome D1 heme domain protein [Clostridium saccharoperbutylacetonicum]NRT61959.1 YVTN family beta-propeller protein [Clostridium saccharoperbutylacetonicum]NSB25288.1 YVTN family beta-propeller protein [Clostridium saccharoperbutylacetonicum]NSB31838.1 YVTN family beta-propeller protein [Clostridium saccharoperbutylac
MSYIILCNTASDSLNKINTEDLNSESIILSDGEGPFGPHGLSLYKDKILVANNYNNSISIINYNNFKEETNLYVGAHPNDIVAINDIAYVLCGESNSVIIYDFIGERINFEIPTGRFPHNATLFEDNKLIFISNMGDDSISVIDYLNNREIKRIKVENIPMKTIISKNKKYLYICLSCLGYDKNGTVGIIDLSTLELINKIEVGNSPVDLFEEESFLYISNLCDGTISVIDLKEFKEKNKIRIGGMPRGIVKVEDRIFVGDYLNGILKVINLTENNVKVIRIGDEPNSMTLCT